MAAIDDATGTITRAQFDYHEGVLPVFDFWKGYLEDQGKPRAIYLDKLSTYKQSNDIAKQNPDALSQFERAMASLGIEPISANSPQAKGRIERLFSTLQDRLIKELRLAGISAIAPANEFLVNDFIPKFNKQFGMAPRLKGNLHTKLSGQERIKMASIFSRQIPRVVRGDFTVSYLKQWYQLTAHQPATVCKRDIVTIEERLTGEIKIRHNDTYLNYGLIPKGVPKQPAPPWILAAAAPKTTTLRIPVRPAANHPWRKFTYSNQARLIINEMVPN